MTRTSAVPAYHINAIPPAIYEDRISGDAAVKFVFIEKHACTWPVNVMCRMLGVSRRGYYD